MRRIHEPHLGIVKSKQLARDLFWPGMNSQIEETVSKCQTCQQSRKGNPAEPMIMHDIPDIQFGKVATNLFELNGRTYVMIVDYYSKFPDVTLLHETTSQATIAALKSTFGRFGIPEIVVGDNGPQYASRQFQMFARHYGFRHVTNGPGYSQSKGQAERCVQNIKNIKKAVRSGQDADLALLNYRSRSRRRTHPRLHPIPGPGQ